MTKLKIGGELDCGVTRDFPGKRFTVRRAAAHSYEVLVVTLDPKLAPSENERVVVTYSELEAAEAHAWGADGE